MRDVDLLVIGGGINGAGIARDAIGRGLSVVLCEKDDFGEGTSSRSGKYIHGGLRYLEYYEFRLVRESLIEREVILKAAPHIVWPLRLVLPHSPEQRPVWLIWLGLFLYDHLGGRKRLPATRRLDLRTAAEGRVVRDRFTQAFEYSDCWVDDARLVLLNALDAARRGATVLSRTAAVSARRDGDGWLVELEDQHGEGERQTVRARCVVNAAGPWVEKVLQRVSGVNSQKAIRLVKGSHIIMKKFWEGPHGYVLQNKDKRLIFVNPYMDDMALIGTTDIPFDGRAEDVAIAADEKAYLLDVLNRYFKVELKEEDILDSYSGVRSLFDDNADNPSAVTRDYAFEVDPETPAAGRAPMLSVYGGKITTYRKLAEHALEKLKPFFPQMGTAWTGRSTLPGGDLPDADFDRWYKEFSARHAWLPEPLARHYARLYGSRADELLAGATRLDQLGRHFGAFLYEREARFLIDEEWALTAEDILWRRTKHRLQLSAEERRAFEAWLAERPTAQAAE